MWFVGHLEFCWKNEKNNSPDFFFRATDHTQKIKFELYSRSCHQRPCFCQTKKVVGDRKSLVTGMSSCCKICGCGCGGWFNVGLMTFFHHWPVVIVDQSTWLRQHFNACSLIIWRCFSEWLLAMLITLNSTRYVSPGSFWPLTGMGRCIFTLNVSL